MTNFKFWKVLIANRGEIALRIQKTCNKLKIPCAITVSEADIKSYFARNADFAAGLKGYTAHESYLNQDLIIKTAKELKCNAIHPGYGFLSENSKFAAKVKESGLIFVGPSSESIYALGDKAKAREIAERCKVPLTKGTAADLNNAELLKESERIGFPLLIKAVAGGGGRGMRVVNNKKEIEEQLILARAEAKKNFLDERVYLEEYILNPRHVEVQVIADNHGNFLHLGTRDCSTQRRHQKLTEEAPAPDLSASLRRSLHNAAIQIAKAAAYNSAGTAEFLVYGEKFSFLEMNTRIQVEHPVTEEITGLDIVELQLRIANNEKLPIKQRQVKFKGHSIEFRINSENCRENFKPVIGKIGNFFIPKAKNLRIERGFESGDEISPYYDGLICKLIVSGKSRSSTVKHARDLLYKSEISGIETTLPFHRWALSATAFSEAPLHVNFIDKEFSESHIRLQELRELTDPNHIKTKGKKEHKQLLNYHSNNFSYSYKIEVVHLKDGTFLFAPYDNKKGRAKESHCRRSNSYNAAYKSLINEVLEKVAPLKIF